MDTERRGRWFGVSRIARLWTVCAVAGGFALYNVKKDIDTKRMERFREEQQRFKETQKQASLEKQTAKSLDDE
eukprot:CFRG0098T1